MFNPPPKDTLAKLPPLYANDKAQTSLADTILHLHLFVSACDWWIAEYDGDDLFWGFVNLGDDECAEWGYILFSELKSITIAARLNLHKWIGGYTSRFTHRFCGGGNFNFNKEIRGGLGQADSIFLGNLERVRASIPRQYWIPSTGLAS